MIDIKGYLDPFKPYLQLIKIVGIIAILTTIFVSGCNHGKNKQAQALAEAKQATKACLDANQTNLKTIEKLEQANALYASESEKQAKVLDRVQKEFKREQALADKREKAIKGKLNDAYKKNPDWSNTGVPVDIKRLLNKAD